MKAVIFTGVLGREDLNALDAFYAGRSTSESDFFSKYGSKGAVFVNDESPIPGKVQLTRGPEEYASDRIKNCPELFQQVVPKFERNVTAHVPAVVPKFVVVNGHKYALVENTK